jgi:transcriptional regulator with XRE-family HTH domain
MAVAGGGRTRVEEADRQVARRIRERRVALGLTQGDLAARLGLTPQQVRRYEAGADRLTAGRLHVVAETLGVGVAHLYEGLPTVAAPDPADGGRIGLALARKFAAVTDRRHQEALLALARALAGGYEGELEHDRLVLGHQRMITPPPSGGESPARDSGPHRLSGGVRIQRESGG